MHPCFRRTTPSKSLKLEHICVKIFSSFNHSTRVQVYLDDQEQRVTMTETLTIHRNVVITQTELHSKPVLLVPINSERKNSILDPFIIDVMCMDLENQLEERRANKRKVYEYQHHRRLNSLKLAIINREVSFQTVRLVYRTVWKLQMQYREIIFHVYNRCQWPERMLVINEL